MPRRSLKAFVLAFISLLLSGIFLTGCNSAKPQAANSSISTTTPQTTPAPSSESNSNTIPHSVTLTLYFPNSNATGLIPTKRTVVLNDQQVIKAIFKELATPPDGLKQPLPTGTTLLSASVMDGVATIDLSPEFKKNFNGGSAGELMTIYSIVNSLTSLSNIQSVQFLLDGKKEDGILGNLDTSVPVERDNSLIVKLS